MEKNKFNFKKAYRDLETRVHHELKEKIKKSKYTSKFVNKKAIPTNIDNCNVFTEITIINDNLTLLDWNGNHYSVFVDCDLEDLIDILENKY